MHADNDKVLEALRRGRDCAAMLLAKRKADFEDQPDQWRVEQEDLSCVLEAIAIMEAERREQALKVAGASGPLGDPDILATGTPAAPEATDLHTFLNAAAGEGLVLDGIDAGDLYQAVFPERYAATVAQIDTGASTPTQADVHPQAMTSEERYERIGKPIAEALIALGASAQADAQASEGAKP